MSRIAPSASPWSRLLIEARAGALLVQSPLHGERHWRAVAATGLAIADLRPYVSRGLVLAFAMLHDCRRFDEDDDPQHGARAAEVAAGSLALREILDPREIRWLVTACELHEKGRTCPENPHIGACWDADRYNLLRLDIRPHRRFLSSGLDDEEHLSLLHLTDDAWLNPPSWDDLITLAEEGLARPMTNITDSSPG